MRPCRLAPAILVGLGDFDINSGLDGDGGDLTEQVSRRVEIDQALVDAHLKNKDKKYSQ